VIIAKNVLAHVPDVQDFLAGISLLTNESTLVVVEAPSILNILQKMQFDTIYHEHFSYLSATFLNSVLPNYGLRLIGIENVETHGGSKRYFITANNSSVSLPAEVELVLKDTLNQEGNSGFGEPSVWRDLGEQLNIHLQSIRSWFSESKGRLIGYGAAAKVVTLLSAAQIPRGAISLCIDNSEAKMNRYISGSHIQIVSEIDYVQNRAEVDNTFVIFPWNLQSEISQRIRVFSPNARVFVLLPTIKEL
jgi:C-methyltransferase C-terminal domain